MRRRRRGGRRRRRRFNVGQVLVLNNPPATLSGFPAAPGAPSTPVSASHASLLRFSHAMTRQDPPRMVPKSPVTGPGR
jgi:hypothetical protein